jgi:PAS domain S-box-containing protein
VSVSGPATVEVQLPAEPMTVGVARRAVRDALAVAGASHLGEVAQLVVSELVTNAVVHAGTPVTLRITAGPDALRVEVEDGSPHLPVLRTWADTAGTGRGLRIVEEHADRWSADHSGAGKVVWFEIGQPVGTSAAVSPRSTPAPEADAVEVVLLAVPVLMHWAWQEHAATLLRDYLLHALGREAGVLDEHASASSALRVLEEQLPRPQLPDDPDALMASSVEPGVTARRVSLRVVPSSLRHFEVLDDLLARAVSAAEDGHLLSPPTQPEMAEMRAWLCGEVAGQAVAAAPTPWRALADVRTALPTDSARARAYRRLSETDEAIIAIDERSVIVAVGAVAVTFLGYRGEDELLGRRVLAVVPARFHQAHIAGTTLHVTNGRDPLLNRWLTVPVVRADGTEVPVEMHVAPRRLDGGPRVFVAQLRL